MNHSGDAAEQIVRMSLEGFEVAARITGSGAKNLAILLYTMLKNEGQSKGKARLTNMLKSGKELKVFTIKNEDLKKFQEEAKRYGVLYCVLKDKDNKNPNAIVDVIARAEDASKINRIVERFNLSSVDKGKIVNEVQRGMDNKKPEVQIETPQKDDADKLLDEAQLKPLQKEEKTQQNPKQLTAEKSPPLERSSKTQKNYAKGTMVGDKPSVREELKRIKNSRKEDTSMPAPDKEKEQNKPQNRQTTHTRPSTRKKSKKPKGR